MGSRRATALDASGPQANGGPRRPGNEVEPGLVLAADASDGILIGAGDGAVSFAEAQPPGKRRMDGADWVKGRGVEAGQRCG